MASDEPALRAVLASAPVLAGEDDRTAGLSGRTSSLVTVAALLALGASTASLRWAVELSWCVGADDVEIAEVLAAIASVAGLACVASSAPRLALAIGYDIGGEDPEAC